MVVWSRFDKPNESEVPRLPVAKRTGKKCAPEAHLSSDAVFDHKDADTSHWPTEEVIEKEERTPLARRGRLPGDSPDAPKAHRTWDEVFFFDKSEDENMSRAQLTQRSRPEVQCKVASGGRPSPAYLIYQLSELGLEPLVAPAASWDGWINLHGFPMSSLATPRMKRTNVGKPLTWKVPASKLQSTDTKAVSPLYELSWCPSVKFKMIVSPSVKDDVKTRRKGGASFKNCKKEASELKLELKCEEGQNALGHLKLSLTFFIIAVHSGSDENREPNNNEKRGPFQHDFSESAVAGLQGEKGWTFHSKSGDKSFGKAREDHLLCGVEISESTCFSKCNQ